jgi:hypothetical protein
MNHHFIADRVNHRFLLSFSGFRVVKDEAVGTPPVIYLFFINQPLERAPALQENII